MYYPQHPHVVNHVVLGLCADTLPVIKPQVYQWLGARSADSQEERLCNPHNMAPRNRNHSTQVQDRWLVRTEVTKRDRNTDEVQVTICSFGELSQLWHETPHQSSQGIKYWHCVKTIHTCSEGSLTLSFFFLSVMIWKFCSGKSFGSSQIIM